MVFPINVPRGRLGALCAVTHDPEETLSDLDFTYLTTFADYSALIIENYYYYREVIEKREAEFQALQSQIQPHFLYNVLGTMVGLNRMGDHTTLENAIFSLRTLMHYTLEEQDSVPLGRELELVRAYCELQRMRFGERLRFDLHADQYAVACLVPKLLLQPLVENAVVHGIEPRETGGTVSVRAAVEAGATARMLRIIVSDDGVGFDPGALGRERRVGLANVERRLQVAYAHAELSLESEPGRGTEITIRIPVSIREPVLSAERSS
jgi:two-component system sensor histidine kinase YesM